jgi:ribosomal protein L37AE/L43A
MCGCTPWFKNHQAGIYICGADENNPQLKGVFVNAYAGSRCYVDPEVCILNLSGLASGLKMVEAFKKAEKLKKAEKAKKAKQSQKADESKNESKDDSKEADESEEEVDEDADPETKKPKGTAISARLRAAHATMAAQGLVGVIIGDKAGELFPMRIPRGEAWAMEYYRITKIWCEMVQAKKDGIFHAVPMWMMKLQKADLSQQSYWARADQIPPPLRQRHFSILTTTELCSTCGKESHRIMAENWLCLNDKCSSFWKINGEIPDDDTTLTYSDEFLQERTAQPSGIPPPLYPEFTQWHKANYADAIKPGMNKEEIFALFKALSSGFCCPLCQMLSRRRLWEVWECRNNKCDFKAAGTVPALSVEQLSLFSDTTVTDFAKLPFYARTEDIGDFVLQLYDLGEDYVVAYFFPKPNKPAALQAKELSKKMLELANKGTLELERRSTKSKTSDAITKHFAVNFGEHYFYGAKGVPDIPFDKAPPEINEAVCKATALTRPLAPLGSGPFNESYVSGYLQSSGMNWHHDGQDRIGPVVGSLSLGGQGTISFGITPHCYMGKYECKKKKKTKINFMSSEEPVLKGCRKEAERKKLKHQLELGEMTQEEYDEALDEALKGSISVANDRTDPRTLLKLPLHSGSFCFMIGLNFQKYFRHMIEVRSPFRIAVTCREVLEGHDPTREKREERQTKGTEVVDTTKAKEESETTEGGEEAVAKTTKRKRKTSDEALDTESLSGNQRRGVKSTVENSKLAEAAVDQTRGKLDGEGEDDEPGPRPRQRNPPGRGRGAARGRGRGGRGHGQGVGLTR